MGRVSLGWTCSSCSLLVGPIGLNGLWGLFNLRLQFFLTKCTLDVVRIERCAYKVSQASKSAT